ncbi:MAG: VCBS repeat-containing protein [Paludibacteraceae bacterium]|nr:VCBS repeat-containing protein [Paludibacteraceae bacterium]
MDKITLTILSWILLTVSSLAGNKVVGGINGSYALSPSGAATYTIPIECPVGVGSMMPQVMIVYNSQGGKGLVGEKWQLAASSAIMKVCPTPYYDDKSQPINYGKSGDYLSLDGQRLIKYKTISESQVEFRTENDMQIRIIRKGKSGSYNFVVYTPDGKTLKYSQLKTGAAYYNGNFGWHLTEAKDLNGNYITYNYTVGLDEEKKNVASVRLSNIEYGGNLTANTPHTCKVDFMYGEYSYQAMYIDGYQKYSKNLLSCINVYSNGQTFRKYTLTYKKNTVGDQQLCSIKVQGNNGDYYDDMAILWNEESEKFTEKAYETNSISSGVPPSQKMWIPFDDDNDGYADLYAIYTKNIGNGTTYEARTFFEFYKNNKGSLSLELGSQRNISGIYKFSDSPMICHYGDLNKPNCIVPALSNDWHFNLLFPCSRNSAYCLRLKSKHGDKAPVTTFADFNKDGYDDIMVIERNKVDGKYPVTVLWGHESPNLETNITGNYGIYGYYYLEMSSAPEKAYATDMTGNGLCDVLVLAKDGYACLQNKGSHKMNNTILMDTFTTVRFVKSDVSTDDNLCVEAGDFNGDGMMDFYINKKNGEVGIWEGTGNFKFFKRTISSPERITDDENDFVVVNDFNGDGKSDIIICKDKGEKILWRKKHDSDLQFYTVVQTINNKSELSKGQIIVGDFDADGHPEVLSAGISTIRSGQNLQNRFYVAKMESVGTSNLVSCIATKFSNTKFNYGTLFDTNLYKKTEVETNGKIVSWLLPLTVVKRAEVDKIYYDYTYSDAFIERSGKGFLGFRNIDTKSCGLTTSATSTLSPVYATLIPTSSLTKNGETKVNKTVSTITCNPILEGSKGFFSRLEKNVTIDYLAGTSITTTYSDHNEFNIPQSVKVSYDGTGISSKTTLSNFKKNTTYNMALPQKKEVKTTNPSGSQQETTTLSYDSKFRMTKEIQRQGTPMAVTSTFSYDAFGNCLKSTTSASGCEKRVTTYTYTPSGRFLESVTRPDGGKVTYTMDEDFVRPIKEETTQGELSFTTQYLSYDGFNNCTKIELPTGAKITTTTAYETNQERGVYHVTVSGDGVPTTKTFYDYKNQAIISEETGFDGEKRVQRFGYNDKGQLTYKSEKFISSSYIPSGGTSCTSYRYDIYGRITEMETSLGSTTYAYNGKKTTIISPMGKRVSEYNGAGQLIKSTENGKSVTFSYYPSGLLYKSTPQGESPVIMEYDEAGNRTKLTDPDTGVMEWVYDAYGREKSMLDAKMSDLPIKTTYDSYGRLSKVTQGKVWQANYTYNASGQLEKVTNNKGYECHYTYNKFDKMTQIKEIISGKELTTDYFYDTPYYGPSKIRYPSGYEVCNTYDGMGNLVSMKNGSKILWKPVSFDSHGNLTKSKSGDVVHTYSYNALDQLLQETAYKGSVGLMDLSYEYDTMEDVDAEEGDGLPLAPRSKYDAIYKNTEDYRYDLLRLSSVSTRNTQSGTGGLVKYDAHNNIKEAADCSAFCGISYGGEGISPHQVSSVRYCHYTPTGERTVTFDGFRMASRIISGNYQYDITFGNDHRRRKTVLRKNGKVERTRYYSVNYDQEVDAQGKIREIDYIYAPEGLVAMHVVDNGKDTLFYTATDRQGSLMAVASDKGSLVERFAYNPWGMRRNVKEWHLHGEPATGRFFRGYCMHEHLDELGLIDMNGRMYDPHLCQFISADPYIQDPNSWLSYNRYAYCMNNPVLYTDPSGELIPEIIVVLAAAYMGGLTANMGSSSNPANFTAWDWSSSATYTGIISGAMSGCSILGYPICLPQARGIIPNALLQCGFNVSTTAVCCAIDDKPFFKNAIGPAVTGLVAGGVTGYLLAKENGANIWSGNKYENEKVYRAKIKWNMLGKHQPNPERDCYAYSAEYADNGHDNRPADYFMEINDRTDGGGDPAHLLKGRKMPKSKFELASFCGLESDHWEFMGNMSIGDPDSPSSHWVNIVEAKIETQTNCFGRSRVVLRSSKIWDPIDGQIKSGGRFNYIGAVTY